MGVPRNKATLFVSGRVLAEKNVNVMNGTSHEHFNIKTNHTQELFNEEIEVRISADFNINYLAMKFC